MSNSKFIHGKFIVNTYFIFAHSLFSWELGTMEAKQIGGNCVTLNMKTNKLLFVEYSAHSIYSNEKRK